MALSYASGLWELFGVPLGGHVRLWWHEWEYAAAVVDRARAEQERAEKQERKAVSRRGQ